jgi:SAM-dependent methyltransferase
MISAHQSAVSDLTEYTDPELYDLENQQFELAGPFYLTLAQQLGSPVLELGCGTGRYTIPLAQHGIAITGLDVVPQMLARAQEKATGLAISWVEADARSFQLNRTFRLIFESGAMFEHLLDRTAQMQMLFSVRQHLAGDGRFVVALQRPTPALMANVTEEQFWFSYTTPAGIEVRVSGTQHYDPVRQVRTETAYRRWTDASGQSIERVAPLGQRSTFPAEMETLLDDTGFAIIERYGNWDFSPLTDDSNTLIYVCAKLTPADVLR